MTVANIWITLLFIVGLYINCVLPKQTNTTIMSTDLRSSISAKSKELLLSTLSTSASSSLSSLSSFLPNKSSIQNHRMERSIIAGPEPTDVPVYCDRFITPIVDNNTFFSPLDPRSATNTYPPNADCVFVLEAPPGYLIKLDFRNKFNIEPSPGCEFDYLEIRDGKHGFANLIGQYCGEEFPPMIYSSERYLWLHFHADENIEYDGFQAVYEFLPRPTSSFFEETSCMFTKNGTEGFVNRTDIDDQIVETAVLHSLNLDCLWQIEVDPGWKILLSFLTFELERKNDCDSNFIDIFGEITDIPSRLKNFCGVIAESVVSKTNKLHIRFFAEKHAVKSRFVILYTAFRPKSKGDECFDEEYDCDDDTCIAKELECNGRTNCKFLKDESECEDKSTANSDHLVIIIVVFSLILGAMTTAFLINCIRKLIRDQKIIREHIRQSKESKLDEAGRISLKRSLENINRIAPRKQASQQSQQRSIHILDDESQRYYQEQTIPMHHHGSLTKNNEHNSYRNLEHSKFQIKDILDATLRRSDKHLDEAGMCDMACQTRESLFSPPGFKPKYAQQTTNSTLPPPDAIRFSTFGYEDGSGGSSTPDGTNRNATLRRQQSTTNPHQHQQHQHHHSHHQHHHQLPTAPQQHLHQDSSSNSNSKSQTPASQGSGNGVGGGVGINTTIDLEDLPPPPPAITCSKHQQHLQHMADQKHKKLEESRIYVDIRNSAPDVIIMTSH